MLKYLFIVISASLFMSGSLYAQEGRVTGQVTDAISGDPLPGVNILIPDLGIGVASDLDGDYVLEGVPFGTHLLRASYVGYRQYEETIELSESQSEITLNITLEPDVLGLDETIITAFGVPREQRSIGYSSQNVEVENMSRISETNFVNSLQGKISGVDITRATGSLGGSTRIVLRGVSSLSGENQPLFVVDGVYIDNSTFDPASEFGGSRDFGNAAMDINPNDIASISVLKGANAAALYGSRAANGAIIITTKDGSSLGEGPNIGITLNSTVTSENILILPNFQNVYGQGRWSPDDGAWIYESTVDESWGPRMEGQLIDQFGDGNPVPFSPQPDNVRDYFERGISLNNNVALAANYDNSHFRLSFTNLDQGGLFPNESLTRNSLSLNAGANLTERLQVDARVAYTNMDGRNRPGVGYNDQNPMQQLTQWFGRQLDMDQLRNYRFEDGRQRNWNYNYFDNPFWIQYENGNRQTRERIIGNVHLSYDLTDWANITSSTGTDLYEDRRSGWLAVGTLSNPNGSFEENVRFVNELSSNIRLNVARAFAEQYTLDASVGAERQNRRYNMNYASAPQLNIPGIYSVTNTAVRPLVDDFRSEKRINSLFASATLGFRDYLYLDVTGRNDWSSTLPAENNSYFYPSASLSFVFTDAFNLDLGWLTYGKLRTGWARVGNDTEPYQLRGTYVAADPFGDVPTYTQSTTIANENLLPEEKQSVEFGTELRFVQNRIRFDATIYNENTTNQILPVQISRASGFSHQFINAGEIRNRGLELTIGATAIQSPSFAWDINLNWATNQNEVISLTEGTDSYLIGSSWDVTVEARPGEEFGSLYGVGFLRDDDGNVLTQNGLPLVDPEIRSFGSFQPDWSGGIMNTFQFRGATLSFLVDAKYGGKISSVTYMFGRYTGILEETLEGREEWAAGTGGYIFDGGRFSDRAIDIDTGEPNNIAVNPRSYNTSFFGNAESHIFDATYVKLRELRLGYSLPARILTNLPVRNVDLGLVGRNLWIIHKEAPHIDPETAFTNGNLQGLESNQFPSVRSFGFNIRLSL